MKNPTIQPNTIWQHYKGNRYEVISLATHSETLEPLVVYRALYGEGDVWVRPLSMWHEEVQTKDGVKPRFALISKDKGE